MSTCFRIKGTLSLGHWGSGRVNSAFTNTGIKAPVGSRNSRCPITLRSEAIDPEWVVNEMYVLTSLVNTSSSSCFMRVWIVFYCQYCNIEDVCWITDWTLPRYSTKLSNQPDRGNNDAANTYIVNRMSLSNLWAP